VIYFERDFVNFFRELAYEYNILFPSQEEEPKKKPKIKKIVNWTKKNILKKLNSNTYIKMGHDTSGDKVIEEFKLSKLNQIISSPVTLKVKNFIDRT